MQQTKRTVTSIAIVLTFILLSQTSFAQAKTSSKHHELKNEELKEFLGQYDPEESGRYFSITISLDGEDRLMAQPTNKSQPNTLMVATEKDYFDLSGTTLVINFNRDDEEKIISLTFTQGAQSFTAKKVKTP